MPGTCVNKRHKSSFVLVIVLVLASELYSIAIINTLVWMTLFSLVKYSRFTVLKLSIQNRPFNSIKSFLVRKKTLKSCNSVQRTRPENVCINRVTTGRMNCRLLFPALVLLLLCSVTHSRLVRRNDASTSEAKSLMQLNGG